MPKRPCATPRCPTLTTGRYCDDCQHAQRAHHRRHHAGGGFYGRKWAEAAKDHLARHPFCVDCLAVGQWVAASEVDHDIPHRGDRRLFWDPANWRSRCKPHHSAKTAREVGFGGRQ